MIVVADTSPINYLILLGHVGVLRILYQRICIPHAVLNELMDAAAPPAVRDWARNPPEWIDTLSPSVHPTPPLQKLDPGETEAIALAEELHADWLLIDDQAGREEAARRNLQTIGTLGILRNAHRLRLLEMPAELTRLRAFGFFVSDALAASLLASI